MESDSIFVLFFSLQQNKTTKINYKTHPKTQNNNYFPYFYIKKTK